MSKKKYDRGKDLTTRKQILVFSNATNDNSPFYFWLFFYALCCATFIFRFAEIVYRFTYMFKRI